LLLPTSVTTQSEARCGASPANSARRRGQHDQVGLADGLAEVRAAAVDDAEFDGAVEVPTVAAVADDLALDPGRTHRARQRATDQADADDAESFEHVSRRAPCAAR
jgi:hypothetical protein